MQIQKPVMGELEAAVAGCKRVLILTHDNPDPDSVASAAGLQYLLKKLWKIPSRLAYGGVFGRAENRAMIRLLRLRLTQVERLQIDRFKHIALVDAQPGTGNSSFPRRVIPTIVIDHHPLRRTTRGKWIDVRKGYGATSTIVTEYLFESGLEVPGDLATALYYGIGSETQRLGRGTSPQDVAAYTGLFSRTNQRVLSQIEHPPLSREYYVQLHLAMEKAFTYRNVIATRIGETSNPDVVPQMADLLVCLERMTWAIAIGRVGDRLHFSIRSTNTKARAGKLAIRLAADLGTAGGHGMAAAGQIPIGKRNPRQISELERDLIQRFLELLGYRDVRDTTPLLAPGPSATQQK